MGISTISTDLSDLRAFAQRPGPFFTALVPAPSDRPDADHRFEVRWAQAKRGLGDGWSDGDLAAVDHVIGDLRHDGGAALAVVHRAVGDRTPTGEAASGPEGAGGTGVGDTFAEFLTASPADVLVKQGPVPSLAPLIEHRQRVIPHVVVLADKAGADITAFDGARVVDQAQVEGDRMHIHRGRFGGWSHRRFQQRAENTWEHNARDVAETAREVADRIGAKLVAVAGPTRARAMVTEELEGMNLRGVVRLEAGDADGIAAEVVDLVDSVRAGAIADLSRRVADLLPNGGAVTGIDATLEALAAGRVDTLLVDDDWTDDTPTSRPIAGYDTGVRAIDAAIVAALAEGGDVVVTPSLGVLDGPLGAVLRW